MRTLSVSDDTAGDTGMFSGSELTIETVTIRTQIDGDLGNNRLEFIQSGIAEAGTAQETIQNFERLFTGNANDNILGNDSDNNFARNSGNDTVS